MGGRCLLGRRLLGPAARRGSSDLRACGRGAAMRYRRAVPAALPATGIDLVRFTASLFAAPDLRALEQRYLAGFGRLLGVRINGFDLVDPETTRQSYSAAVNVSDAFLACYRRTAWDVD